MSEHEKLKAICDKIWYDEDDKIVYQTHKGYFIKDIDFWDWWVSIVDVREIMFKQKFMDKFMLYFQDTFHFTNIWVLWFRQYMFKNLDNPVDYIYNLTFPEWQN